MAPVCEVVSLGMDDAGFALLFGVAKRREGKWPKVPTA
jgi:hypothetical protein